MADTSFVDGDLFIGFGDVTPPSSAPASPASPPPPSPSVQSEAGPSGSTHLRFSDVPSDESDSGPVVAGKKRKGDTNESTGKRRKTRRSPEPRPDDRTGPQNLKDERRAGARNAPWAADVDWERCRDPAEMLNDEIACFYRLMTPTEGEYAVRKSIIETITHHLLVRWPDAEIIPFGSWQTQLYLPTGDLDLVMSFPGPEMGQKRKRDVLFTMASTLRNAGITDKVAVIVNAKVPIVKFVTKQAYGNIPVDISLNQVNGVSAGKIISHYLDAMPGARELITVVKAFLSQRSMNEVYTGGLGSYSVICMVVSFMQMHPKLRRAEIDARRNLGALLIEFFELYGRNFNYDDVGISLRRGGHYYLKKERGWKKTPMTNTGPRGGPNPRAQPFLLSIEDPQCPDNDISSGSYGIAKVKMTLGGAYDVLRSRLFDRAAQIRLRDQVRRGEWVERSKREGIPSTPEDWSILSAVMGVTKETLKFRSALEQLYEHGRIERDLQAMIRFKGTTPRLHNPPPRPDAPGVSAEERARELRHERGVYSSEEEGEASEGGGRGDGRGAGKPPAKSATKPNAVAQASNGKSNGTSSASSRHATRERAADEARAAARVAGWSSSALKGLDVPDGTSASGAIMVDSESERDDRAVSLSSHTTDDSSVVAASSSPRDTRSVSEDMDLYSSNDERAQSRYAAPGAGAKKRRRRQKTQGAKKKAAAAAAGTGAPQPQAQATTKFAIKGAANPAASVASTASGASTPRRTYPASAGPSRTTSPPLAFHAAASAPVSPRPTGRERWVPRADRAAYWASKGMTDTPDDASD